MPTATAIARAPRGYSRIAGALYVTIILLGLYSQGYVQSALVVGGDAAATVKAIAANPTLWLLGTAAAVALPVIGTLQMWIEYVLFRPAAPGAALGFLILNTVSLAVEAVSKVFLAVIGSAAAGRGLLGSLDPAGVETVVALCLAAHHAAFHVALIFFGLTCLAMGEIIRRAGYLPAWIGGLMLLAGAAYLIACVAVLFVRPLAEVITPAILIVPLVAESSLALWLLIRGVDPARWHAKAAELRRTA